MKTTLKLGSYLLVAFLQSVCDPDELKKPVSHKHLLDAVEHIELLPQLALLVHSVNYEMA